MSLSLTVYEPNAVRLVTISYNLSRYYLACLNFQSKSEEAHNSCVNNNGQTTSKQGLVVNSFSSLAVDLHAVISGSNLALISGWMFFFTVHSNQRRSTNDQLVAYHQASY